MHGAFRSTEERHKLSFEGWKGVNKLQLKPVFTKAKAKVQPMHRQQVN